jgi:hypothetical protein
MAGNAQRECLLGRGGCDFPAWRTGQNQTVVPADPQPDLLTEWQQVVATL